MVIIVFLVDTSGSMNQRTSLGTTLLDVAKNAVEQFTKLRQRDQGHRTDRYMLVTFDEPPGAVKAGWKENQATFMAELKNLQATGLSTLGASLKEAFDLLNLYRLQSGIDNYGMGRNPFYCEPAMIICITDGSRLSSQTGIQDELHLPMHSLLPGSELTKEPFRWDQRLFAMILRMSGTRAAAQAKQSSQPSNDPAVAAMCEVTGGKCYKCMSAKSVGQALESLAQKVQCGVVVNFEKIGGTDSLPPPVDGTRVTLDTGTLRDSDSPTPNVNVEITNHIGNNLENDVELLNKNLVNMDGSCIVKTEGMPSNGIVPPGTGPRGDDQAILLSPNHVFPEENGNSIGISRSATASPVPQSTMSTAWMSCRKMIYVKTNPRMNTPIGHWPIPESTWPDPSLQTLPSRDAHPTVFFSCSDAEPLVLDNLPFDKYELEPSPLTQYILERKSPSTCWQIFVYSSGKAGDIGSPFGYLKASSNLQSVNLFVMPYNYPVIIPLLDDLVKVHKIKPTQKWKHSFENYLANMPSYYAGPLRSALRRMGIPPTFVPDHLDGSLSYTVQNYLKKVKQQGKIEAERLVNLVGKSSTRDSNNRPILSISSLQLIGEGKDFRQLLNNSTSVSLNSDVRQKANDKGNVDAGLPPVLDSKEGIKTQSYKNPFDISRKELLDQLSRMRINFFHNSATTTRLQDEDSRHSIAIAQMGNFQEVLKQMNPLRELDPGQNRAHMFGNPFKLAKDQQVMIDEADVNEAIAGPQQKKVRPMSPRDIGRIRRKRLDSPILGKRSPGTVVSPPPTPPPTSPQQANKLPAQNKTVQQLAGKINNLVQLGENNRKRKLPEEVNDRTIDVKNKSPKTQKHINPQLKKLQLLHQNKQAQLNRLQNTTAVSGKNATSLNSFAKSDSAAENISSILRKAITSQDKPESKKELYQNNVGAGKSRRFSTVLSESSESEIIDMDGYSTVRKRRLQSKSLSPSASLKRAWQEDNIRLRTVVFKEIRKAGISDDQILNQLEAVKGTREMQCEFVREILDEANLFKKRTLAESLKRHLVRLESMSSSSVIQANYHKR